MGIKDSLQNVFARIAGHTAGDPGVSPVQEAPRAQAENLLALEAKLGYTFRDRTLLHNALLHRSHIHVTGQEREQSNERLEFLGDAVLGLLANEYLFQLFPDRSEGDLTKMKSLLVCGARLSEVATSIDLGIHVRMSRSEAATGGRQRPTILADTTEALIGAVYLDGGLNPAREMVHRVILKGSEQVLARRSLRNYKSRLQEMIQARYKSPPRYRIVEVEGPDHDRQFKVAVMFGGKVLGSGEGRSKKTAEQRAARQALEVIESQDDILIEPDDET
jgi:ribonuclease-3|nr:ribonuclease III [Candidatus Krumholzibacteria bacterium]